MSSITYDTNVHLDSGVNIKLEQHQGVRWIAIRDNEGDGIDGVNLFPSQPTVVRELIDLLQAELNILTTADLAANAKDGLIQ